VSNWGSDGFKKVLGNTPDERTLQDLIGEFPVKLKQAMFSAASHGPIRRGTWTGCALNAAGVELEKAVYSPETASETFGITHAQAVLFIECWDRMDGSNEECTEKLREMIEQEGLFRNPGEKVPRIIRVKVYEDQQKKLREQFDMLMVANMIPDTEAALDLLTAKV
jgi:hypothetical protein